MTINFLTRNREAVFRRLPILSQMPDITSVSISCLKYRSNIYEKEYIAKYIRKIIIIVNDSREKEKILFVLMTGNGTHNDYHNRHMKV